MSEGDDEQKTQGEAPVTVTVTAVDAPRGTPAKYSASGGLPKSHYQALAKFSDQQVRVIDALADTFWPSLPDDVARGIVRDTIKTMAAGAPSEADLALMLRASAGDVRATDCVLRILTASVPVDKKDQLGMVLWALSTPWGCALITGSRRAAFFDLAPEEREKAMLALANSKYEVMRGLFKSIKSACLMPVFAKDLVREGIVPEGSNPNPNWPAIQYAGQPDEKERPPRSDAWEPKFEDVKALAEKANGKPIVLETDVVIVGSGVGGGVVAAELAQAGYRVIVVEKAMYRSHADLSSNELESLTSLYDFGGAIASENGVLQLLAGSAFGGGSFVNWCASLRTPHTVREEWATKFGLPYFASSGFSDAMDKICERVGVTEDPTIVKHNHSNRLFVEGCKRLGYDHSLIPQNINGQVHECGFCTFGCPYSTKQGSHLTWLKDAQEAGAVFIDGCKIARVTTSWGKATGVVGTVLDGSVQIIIKAPTVVSSCGSIQTPALLLRSGLRNSNIGRNLRLHPVTTVHGFFPDVNVRPFSGACMTALSRVVANHNGNGYGALLECCATQPAITNLSAPWRGGAEFKKQAAHFPRQVNLIVLTRDLDSKASVWIDGKGDPRVEFTLGKKDADVMVEGIEKGARIMLAAGATEVHSTQLGVPTLKLESEADRKNAARCATTEEWVKKVKAAGVKPNAAGIVCAHQMGSCRMGKDRSMGAVNPDGETWEVKGLYVADASLFPTASGVNPMLTNYAVSYSVAQFMKRNLERQKQLSTAAAKL